MHKRHRCWYGTALPKFEGVASMQALCAGAALDCRKPPPAACIAACLARAYFFLPKNFRVPCSSAHRRPVCFVGVLQPELIRSSA